MAAVVAVLGVKSAGGEKGRWITRAAAEQCRLSPDAPGRLALAAQVSPCAQYLRQLTSDGTKWVLPVGALPACCQGAAVPCSACPDA